MVKSSLNDTLFFHVTVYTFFSIFRDPHVRKICVLPQTQARKQDCKVDKKHCSTAYDGINCSLNTVFIACSISTWSSFAIHVIQDDASMIVYN